MSAPHRPVRIGVQLHPQHADYAAIRDAVARAEDLGADVVYNWDHFFPLYGDADGKHFEAWTMLAAWAEQTSRIEIGCLVTCNSYRNPNLLADMARSIDHISGGRLILGMGSGWFERDYDEYGYEFGTVGSRLDRLGENLPVIKDRWSKLNPAPSRDIPILIGGVGPRKTLRFVAEHAQIWHALFPGSPGDVSGSVDTLRNWCAEYGRDPAEIEAGIGLQPGDAPRVLAEHADEYLSLGFTQFTFGTNGPDYSYAGLEDWLAWRDDVNAR
ncbi:MAG: LLM class F420-dependent oxidoreductase [Ilumatobacter sp.]|uniref:LLM class F420-dependent oxidoreductase n=1 Tax=Ilumatobacter sp. TaxID=1967498 RepID=UPI00263738E5|nr:LLM class F420-dependent oxidoreductase [Ilumatobacter sp.]MDJ0767711.1 LLM class F420-dependent oxidoreductase [Ilumatobacter sp.]